MSMIDESRITIYRRMNNEPEFRVSIIHTWREIDAIYLRLYKLVL